MRHDLDRLGWWWWVLAVASAGIDFALEYALVQSDPWVRFSEYVIDALSAPLVRDLNAVLALGFFAAIVLPLGLFAAMGFGLIERRRWALYAAFPASLLAVFCAPPFGALLALSTAITLGRSSARATLRDDGLPIGWRVSALLSLNRRPIREVSADPGGVMDVEVPDGGAAVRARTVWSGANRVAVVDGEGRQHLVDPEHPLTLGGEGVAVQVAVIPQLPVRRFALWSLHGSLLWLTLFVAASLLTDQTQLVWAIIRCPVFGIECPAAGTGAGGPGVYSAEYLARLLKKDYSGDDHGALMRDFKRPNADRPVDPDHFYLPAGNKGPITEMGGAAETAPQPVRAPQNEDEPPIPKKKKPRKQVVAHDGAVPSPATPVPDDGTADATRDLPTDGRDQDEIQTPAEEKQGWGVQDWYDQEDERLDALEIETMIRAARSRLKINPNDPLALSWLSYYQYLAQDYSAAEATYDRYIDVLPDDAAGYNNKALVYKRRGEYDKEEGLYRVALGLQPDDPVALNNLAVNLAHQHRFDEALAIMKQLETIDKDDPYADLHRAKIYAEMGKDEISYHYLDLALSGMKRLDTLHHIEFRQDIRLDPSFEHLRQTQRFHDILTRYYGKDSPLQEQ